MSEINPKNENPKKSCLQSCRSAALERVKSNLRNDTFDEKILKKVTMFPIFLQFGLEPSANYLNFGKDVISRTDRMHVLVKIHPVSLLCLKLTGALSCEQSNPRSSFSHPG